MDYIHLDTVTVTTTDGSKSFLVAVIGDPCKEGPSSLQKTYTDGHGQAQHLGSQAPEVTCDGRKLKGATESDNGYPILSLFLTAEGTSSSTAVISANDGFTSASGMTAQCAQRGQSGYDSGMSSIFRKIASITPIQADKTQDEHKGNAPNLASAAEEEPTQTGDQRQGLDGGSSAAIAMGCLAVGLLVGAAIYFRNSQATAAPFVQLSESSGSEGNEPAEGEVEEAKDSEQAASSTVSPV